MDSFINLKWRRAISAEVKWLFWVEQMGLKSVEWEFKLWSIFLTCVVQSQEPGDECIETTIWIWDRAAEYN